MTSFHSAILSDITTPQNRAKALAHVGIAFAICFIIGPPIGAYFASRPLPSTFTASGFELNVYATPAVLTLILLVLETIFLIFALPETRGKRAQPTINGNAEKKANGNGPKDKTNANGKANGTNGRISKEESVKDRIRTLNILRSVHFMFLGLFSGVEFTLTFLTFDRKCLNRLANSPC